MPSLSFISMRRPMNAPDAASFSFADAVRSTISTRFSMKSASAMNATPRARLIRSLSAFQVEQGASDVGAVKETISRLQEGHVLNIYPGGSRTDDGKMLPLEKGAGLVIRRAKVPVVPAVIVGSYKAWPKHSK